MALRVFYPSFVSARHHPYLDFVEQIFPTPNRKIKNRCRRLCRPDFILDDDDWRKAILEEFFEFDQSSDDETKTVEQKSQNKFNLNLDLNGFDSNDIKVKTIGQKLIVDAEKEENTEEDGFKTYSRKQFHKSIVLPDNVKPDDIKSSLTNKGLLRISAPVMSLPAPDEREKEIVVEKEESTDESVENKQYKMKQAPDKPLMRFE